MYDITVIDGFDIIDTVSATCAECDRSFHSDALYDADVICDDCEDYATHPLTVEFDGDFLVADFLAAPKGWWQE